jgi:excisionase family DNA binding protein
VNDTEAEPLLYTMEQAAQRLNCGRGTLYRLVQNGEIVQLHLGRAARIPAVVLQEFVARRTETVLRRRDEADAWELVGRRRGGF